MHSAVSDEIFFIATNKDILEEAIDAQNGENLGGVAEYQNTVADLPSDRALTVYVSGEGLEDFSKAAEDSGDFEGFDADAIEDLGFLGVGMSAMTTPEGIRLDFVGSFESLSEEQKELLDAQNDDMETAAFLPDSTYLYIVGERLDLAWQSSLDSLSNAGFEEDDIEEAMDAFDDLFGFNPSDDLIPLLDGEYSIALIDSNDGLIAEELNNRSGRNYYAGWQQQRRTQQHCRGFQGRLGRPRPQRRRLWQ